MSTIATCEHLKMQGFYVRDIALIPSRFGEQMNENVGPVNFQFEQISTTVREGPKYCEDYIRVFKIIRRYAFKHLRNCWMKTKLNFKTKLYFSPNTLRISFFLYFFNEPTYLLLIVGSGSFFVRVTYSVLFFTHI